MILGSITGLGAALLRQTGKIGQVVRNVVESTTLPVTGRDRQLSMCSNSYWLNGWYRTILFQREFLVRQIALLGTRFKLFSHVLISILVNEVKIRTGSNENSIIVNEVAQVVKGR